MADIKKIIECIDTYLERNHQEYMLAPEANELLEENGLLGNSSQQPGKPLRDLLRANKIPHAYQFGTQWRIPHSGNKKATKAEPTTKSKIDTILGSLNLSNKSNETKNVSIDNMTTEQLFKNVIAELNSRHLKSNVRFNALGRIKEFVRKKYDYEISCFQQDKQSFKQEYKDYKDSELSGAESSAINELYNQFREPTIGFNEICMPQATDKNDDLMDINKFRRVCDMKESDFPLTRGMYAIMVDDEDSLPKEFADELKKRNHKLLYIGITTATLRSRLWSQELHAERPATFFRSMGAILGFLPRFGSMSESTRNYKFSSEDNQKIIDWFSNHLLINFITMSENIKEEETRLISEYKPIINIAKNPYKMKELESLRKKCQDIAWGK